MRRGLRWIPTSSNKTLTERTYCTCRLSRRRYSAIVEYLFACLDRYIRVAHGPIPPPSHKIGDPALPNVDSQEIRSDPEEARALHLHKFFCPRVPFWRCLGCLRNRPVPGLRRRTILTFPPSPASTGHVRVLSSLRRLYRVLPCPALPFSGLLGPGLPPNHPPPVHT